MEFVSYTKRRSVGVRRGALAGKCRLLAFGVSALGEPPILLSLLEGDYFVVCRIVVECIAKPLNFEHSRIFNSYLILPKCKR